MMMALFKPVLKIMNPAWLTGPIFAKELCISSRRKRNYVLRFLYLALLTFFIILVWMETVTYGSYAAYAVSQMSEAGKIITTTIIIFQFITAQIIAIVMLSNSISDEIYSRTLGVLMTTPINSFQIVMGKILSKLLQLILLLAVSLPLLAIIRVFGGVPWNYVLSSLCITLTAAIFAGTLSLYFSISSRRAYAVILRTAFALGVFYLFIPLMISLFCGGIPFSPFRAFFPNIILPVLTVLNPFVVMQVNTTMMMSPGGFGVTSVFGWPLHCAIMLAASACLLARSVKIVRRVALRQAAGQLDPTAKRKHRRKQNNRTPTTSGMQEAAGLIRPVKGSPLVWKEMKTPIIQGGKNKGIIGLVLTIVVLLVTYGIHIKQGLLNEDFTHMTYAVVFVLMGLITTTVLSATSITAEKESRSWPILLTTTMTDWQILVGKAVAIFRRCLVVWIFLAGHLVLFIMVRYIHPIAAVHLAMLVTWIVIFLSGSGLYFSARFKRTTSAVVANIALALFLWVIIPVVLGIVGSTGFGRDLSLRYVSANPVVQTAVIMNASAGSYNAANKLSDLDYDWPFDDHNRHRRFRCDKVLGTTRFLLFTMVSYVSIGLFFAWRAKCRLRRNIF